STTGIGTGAQGQPLEFETPEPWPDRVDGDELLTELRSTFARYLALPIVAGTALALWTLHTYLLDVVDVCPLLAITSPQKRCGKTTLLTLLHALCLRPLFTSNVTPAALFRTIETATPTLLIDEAETFLSRSEELRGILNAGHTRTTA